MRFMALMIPGDKDVEKGKLPTAAQIDAMMKFNEELVRSGVLLSADGLHPTARGARVSSKGGKKIVTDGPFAEAREVIGGYWMWQVKSKEEAVEWAKRCPLGEGDTIELRQVHEMSDFGDAAPSPETIDRVSKGMQQNAKRR